MRLGKRENFAWLGKHMTLIQRTFPTSKGETTMVQ
jgi:hypothetical protein